MIELEIVLETKARHLNCSLKYTTWMIIDSRGFVPLHVHGTLMGLMVHEAYMGYR